VRPEHPIRRQRSWGTNRFRWSASFLTALSMILASFVLITPATSAEADDRAEAEGQLVNVGSLTSIAELRGAYSAYGDGVVDDTSLDLSALGLVNLVIPSLIDLDLGEIAELGVVGQYARSGPPGARGASGAITEQG